MVVPQVQMVEIQEPPKKRGRKGAEDATQKAKTSTKTKGQKKERTPADIATQKASKMMDLLSKKAAEAMAMKANIKKRYAVAQGPSSSLPLLPLPYSRTLVNLLKDLDRLIPRLEAERKIVQKIVASGSGTADAIHLELMVAAGVVKDFAEVHHQGQHFLKD